jgi:hypothetical protein
MFDPAGIITCYVVERFLKATPYRKNTDASGIEHL